MRLFSKDGSSMSGNFFFLPSGRALASLAPLSKMGETQVEKICADEDGCYASIDYIRANDEAVNEAHQDKQPGCPRVPEMTPASVLMMFEVLVRDIAEKKRYENEDDKDYAQD
jgi:hypothetical protein